MNVQIPDLSSNQRELLEKYLPLLLAIGVGWLAARGIKKTLWSLFGMTSGPRATISPRSPGPSR